MSTRVAASVAPFQSMTPPPSETTTTIATFSSSSYHLQYEKKQKNVSRLLATLTPTTDPIAVSTAPASGTEVAAKVAAAMNHISTTLQSPALSSSPSATTASLPLTSSTTTKGPTIIYPTVAPESVVIPIVSSIIGFPILALLVICCLRKRAKMARERDRRRNYDMQDHTTNLVRFGNRLNGRNSRTLSVCSERSISWAYPSMDLDTVYEERSDPEPYRDKY